MIGDDDDDDDFQVIEESPRRPPPKKTAKTPSPHKKSPPVKKINSVKNSGNKRRIRDDDDDDDSDDDFKFEDEQNSSDDDGFKDDDDDDDDDDDGSDDDFEDEKPKKSKAVKKKAPAAAAATTPKKASPTKRARKTPTKKEKKPTIEVLEPTVERNSFDVDSVKVPECLAGLTFVFTGNMDNLSRDDATDLVKTLGGRVTTAVSGKTNYLVVGPLLEDGRDYTEGSKYRKAAGELKDKVKIVMGEKKMYGLCQMYHEKAMKEKGIDPLDVQPKKEESKPSPAGAAAAVAPSSASKPAVNPYTKVPLNPYAKKPAVASNPYAKKPPANPYAKTNPYANKSSSSAAAASASSSVKNDNPTNQLWVDRYKPKDSMDILGNKQNVTKLQNWLKSWERTFNNAKASNKTFSNPKGPWKAALLSGPPGIGSKLASHCFHDKYRGPRLVFLIACFFSLRSM